MDVKTGKSQSHQVSSACFAAFAIAGPSGQSQCPTQATGLELRRPKPLSSFIFHVRSVHLPVSVLVSVPVPAYRLRTALTDYRLADGFRRPRTHAALAL